MEKKSKQLAILGLTGAVAVSSLGGCADQPFYADTSTDTVLDSDSGSGENTDLVNPSTSPDVTEGGTPSPSPDVGESESTSPSPSTSPDVTEEGTPSPSPDGGDVSGDPVINDASCDYSTNKEGITDVFYEDAELTFVLSNVSNITSLTGISGDLVQEDNTITLTAQSSSLPNFEVSNVSIAVEDLHGEIKVFAFSFKRFVGVPEAEINVNITGTTYEADDITYYTGELSVIRTDMSDFIESNIISENEETMKGILTYKIEYANGEISETPLGTFILDETAPEVGEYTSTANIFTSDDEISYIIEDGTIDIPITDIGSGLLNVATLKDGVTWNEETGVLQIDTSAFPNYEILGVIAIATDNIGNSADIECNLYKSVGLSELEVTSEIEGTFVENNEINYYNSDLTVHSFTTGSSEGDALVQSIRVFKDDIEVSSLNLSDSFTISEDGTYSYKAVLFDGEETQLFNIGTFEKDTEGSNIKEDVSGIEIKEGYIISGDSLVYEVKDKSGVASIEVSGLPEDSYAIEDNKVTVNLSVLGNLVSYAYKIVAVDKLGNSSSQDYEIKLLNVSDLSHDIDLSGDYYSVDGIVYYNTELSVSSEQFITDEFEKEAIQSVEILKDGVVFGYDSVILSEETGSFVARITYVTGDVCEDFIANLSWDTACEGTSLDDFTGTLLNGEWVTENGILTYRAVDDLSGVSSVEVTGLPEGSYGVDGTVISVNTEALPNLKEYSFTIKTTDNLGNVKEDSFTFKKLVGIENLEHDATIKGDIYVRDNVMYYNTDLSLSLSDIIKSDFELKSLSAVEVLLNDEVVANLKDTNTYLFTNESGAVSIRLLYLSGQELVFNSGSISYDNTVEGTVESSFTGEKEQGSGGVIYITADGDLTYAVTDFGSGVKNITVSGIPEEAYQVVGDTVVVNTQELSNLSSHSIVITVEDNLGNITENTFSFSKLVNLGNVEHDASLKGITYEKDNVLYYNSELSLSLSDVVKDGFELGSLNSAVVLLDGEEVGNLIQDKTCILDAVSGKVQVVLSYVSGQELVLESGTIIYDSTVEGTTEVSFTGERVFGIVNSDVLYITKDGVLTYQAEDAGSGIASIEVSGVADGSYSINGNVVSLDTSKLENSHAYTVSIKVTDNLGNIKTDRFAFSRLVNMSDIEYNTLVEGTVFDRESVSYYNSELTLSLEKLVSNSFNRNAVVSANVYLDDTLVGDLKEGSCSFNGESGSITIHIVYETSEEVDLSSNTISYDDVVNDLEENDWSGTRVTGSNGTEYVVEDGMLTYVATDIGSGIKDIMVTGLPEEAVLIEGSSAIIDTSKLNNLKEYNYSIKVEDNLGNSISSSYTLNHLVNVSGINHEVTFVGDYYQGADTKYYNSDLFVRLSDIIINDFELGTVSSVQVQTVDGEIVGELLDSNEITVNEVTNEYQVVITYVTGEVVTESLGSIIHDNLVDSITETSITAETRQGTDSERYLIRDGIVEYTSVDSLSGIQSIEVSGLPENSYIIEGNTVKVDTSVLNRDGVYLVKVTSVDNVGNSSTVTFTINMLRDGDLTPATVNSVKTQGYAYVSGISYIKNAFNFELNVYDSRVSKVELLKDGDFYQDVTDCSGTIDATGDYSLRVTTILGVENIPLTLNDNVSSSFVKDTVFDMVSYQGTDCTEVTGTDNIVYITTNGNLNFYLEDNLSGLDHIEVVDTNGEAVEFSQSGGDIKINTEQFVDGHEKLTITGYDHLGNSKSVVHEIDILREVPNITGINHSSVVNIDNKSYSKTHLSLNISGHTHSKIQSIQIYKDGEYASDIINGVGTITENGNYTIRTEDVAGNLKWYSVNELFSVLSNDIVVDLSNPVSSLSVNGQPIVDTWLTEDSTLEFRFTDNEALLKGSIIVNGQAFNYDIPDGARGYTGSIDLKNAIVCADNGIYKVSATVQDRAGNVFTSEESAVYYDYTAPVVKVDVSGRYTQDSDGYLYVDGSLKVTDSGCSDIGSGIEKIELLCDGNVVGNSVTGMVVSKDGTYSVKVTDKAGLATEVLLSEFIEGITSSKIRIDSASPVSVRKDGFDYELNKDGYVWYSKYPTFKFNIIDQYIKSVSIKVNGDEKVSGISPTGEYTISTEGYAGIVKIDVLAKDKYSHTVSDSYTYRTDLSAPSVTGATLVGNYLERGGVLFFKSNPSVLVTAEDTETGIKTFNLGGSRVESKVDGQFGLGTGAYTVEIVDYIGNSTGALSVKDLCNLPSNEFIVDAEAPKIITNRPVGDVDGWFANDVEYVVNLTDNQGIKSATITINGKVVTDYTSPTIYTTEATIKGSTANVEADTMGGYNVAIDVVDNAGNVSHCEDYIKIDRTAPVVEFFEFTGDGYMEGKNISGSDMYGFYFTGASSVRIRVSDGKISSGMNNLYVTLKQADGTESTQTVKIDGGYATINLPVNFKGFISAYADDMVANVGAVNRPDGIISEDANYFVNNLRLSIELQNTEYRDITGYPLYNQNTSAVAIIDCGWSGVREISWGTSLGQSGSVTINNDGSLSGDVASVSAKDKNLVVDLSQVLMIEGNVNEIEVWIEVTDRVGYKSRTSQIFSIDIDAPVLEVTWNTTEQDNYYNVDRIATVRVTERNFDPELVTLNGKYGKFSGWSGGGDSWVCSLVFNEDDVYNFSVQCKDRAGLPSNIYESGEFVIDKTNPTISVSWDNDSYKNGKYFDKSRHATITVIEHNFNPNLFTLEGTGTLSGWSGSGDTHTATVSFENDGEYVFSIQGKDMADNEVTVYESGDFTIDTVAPTLEILGVENGISYKKDVRLEVNIADEYIDSAESYVSLVGKRHGEIKLDGDFTLKSGKFVFEDFPMEADWDDIYTVKVHVVDMSGNTTEGEVTFSVNRFGSSYEFLDAGLLGSYIREAKDIVIRETNVDRLNVEKARIVVILNGEEVEVPEGFLSIEEVEGNDGRFNYTYYVNKEAFSKDGRYLVQIYSVSYDGTENSSLSQEYAFVLDTTAPEIVISGIEGGGVYHDYSQYVTFDIREAIGVKSISVMLNGVEVPLTEENGIYSLTILESDSRQSLVIAVEDIAGNKTVVEVSDFFITSSMFSYLMNQWWFKATIGGVFALIAFLLLLLFKNRRDARKEEEKVLKDNVDLYKSSTLSSSGSSSADTKDEVEDLDKE